MVTNVAIDFMRSKQSRDNAVNSNLRLVKTVGRSGADRDRGSARKSRSVFNAVSNVLSPKQKTIFVMSEMEDLRSSEIAKVLGCRESTVRNHLFNARKLMQAQLQEALPRIRAAVGGIAMMTCHYFRANLQPGNADAAMLEHLRHCDACLDFAMSVDPDLFFRSLGGEELVPPGGIDAFVGDVMSQVRVHDAEASLAPRHAVSAWQRLGDRGDGRCRRHRRDARVSLRTSVRCATGAVVVGADTLQAASQPPPRRNRSSKRIHPMTRRSSRCRTTAATRRS